MNKNSRTYNFIVNLIFGVVFSLSTIVINFVVRIAIVKSLGEEINGLQSLFSNMISIMTIIETSASMAMIIHLYKPVNENDEDKILRVMSFYKKIYTVVALIFAFLCLIIDIFLLEKLVTTSIEIKKLHVYFFMFSLSFVLNYFTYYSKCLLYAEQKNRVISIINLLSEMIFRGLQILVVVLWKQYYLYLVLMIAEKLFSNLMCSCYVKKYHPMLRKSKTQTLEKEEKKKILNSMKPIAISQSSSAIYNSSKSILISLLLGNISIVGYYGNYQLIVSAVETLFSQFGAAFTAGFGNLMSNDNEKNKAISVYSKSLFYIGWVSVLFCVGFFCCIQPFIELCFGNRFVIANSCVLVITINLFLTLISIPIISVQNAMGLHKIDQYMMVMQSFVGIVLGYIGGINFGMLGILIGSLMAYLIFTFLIKGCLVYSKAFGKNGKAYLLSTFKYIIYLFVVLIISISLVNCFKLKNIFFNLVASIVISIAVWALFFVLFSLKNNWFRELICKILRRKKDEKDSICIK